MSKFNRQHIMTMLLISCISFAEITLADSASITDKQVMMASTYATAPDNLVRFISSALPNHPRYKAAKEKLYAAQQLYKAADRAIYNPEIELDTEKTDIRTSTIGINQTIDWSDQRGAKVQTEKQNLIAAQFRFQRERQQLIKDLLVSLSNYKIRNDLANLSQQRITLMKEFHDIAKQKYQAGDLNKVELYLAKLAYSEAVLDNAQTLADKVSAQQNFYALYYSSYSDSGRAPSAMQTLPDFNYAFTPIHLPEDIPHFLLTLPQMKIARAEVEASKANIALQKSEKSANPTIGLRGGKEDKESLVGLTISFPLNIRNSYGAEIQAAQHEYLQAEQLAQQAIRNLERDIITAARRYQLTQKAWKLWKDNGQMSVKQQFITLKKLWTAGDLSTADYLVQIKQNIDTQSAGLNLQMTLWQNWFEWLEQTARIEPWLKMNSLGNK